MKKIKFRQIISLFIATIMVLTMLPISSVAESLENSKHKIFVYGGTATNLETGTLLVDNEEVDTGI